MISGQWHIKGKKSVIPSQSLRGHRKITPCVVTVWVFKNIRNNVMFEDFQIKFF